MKDSRLGEDVKEKRISHIEPRCGLLLSGDMTTHLAPLRPFHDPCPSTARQLLLT